MSAALPSVAAYWASAAGGLEKDHNRRCPPRCQDWAIRESRHAANADTTRLSAEVSESATRIVVLVHIGQ
jgi:hypothetical protein